MSFEDEVTTAGSFTVAVVIACEVPPLAKPDFPQDQIALARRAVADVIYTRCHFWSKTPLEVVLAKKQFSCVGEDYWISAMSGRWFPYHVQLCLEEWRRPRRVFATHYFSPVSMKPPGSIPDWIRRLREVRVPEINALYFRFFTEELR